MTPIERAQNKAEAISVLGLCGSESIGEIRRAWKRKALETHPDQMGGDTEAFLRAKAAYELLRSEEPVAKPVSTPDPSARVTPKRPGERAKTVFKERTLTPAEQAECVAVLQAVAEEGTHDHVAEMVQMQGRSLVYIVAAQINGGTNRVALPADILATKRSVDPKIISFNVPCMTSGEVVIPEKTRLELFPGARSVRIRFSPNLNRH